MDYRKSNASNVGLPPTSGFNAFAAFDAFPREFKELLWESSMNVMTSFIPTHNIRALFESKLKFLEGQTTTKLYGETHPQSNQGVTPLRPWRVRKVRQIRKR